MKEQSGFVYTGFQHDELWIGRHGEQKRTKGWSVLLLLKDEAATKVGNVYGVDALYGKRK